MIRASIDMRFPNQSIKRSQCVQLPRVEDFIYRLHDCKITTKLDLGQGCHQLALNPFTRQIATFSTAWGDPNDGCLEQNGHKTSSTKPFSESLKSKRRHTPGGRDHTEPREVLKTFLKLARDHGMEQIEFFGHVLTNDEMKPSPDKVRAVKECGVPENKETVRSFLGMAGYLDNFIKNDAAIAAPLYQLTRKGNQTLLG